MPLHGSILVNGHPVASWSARRTEIVEDEDAYYVYEWEYEEYYSQFPGVRKTHYTGQIEHRYNEGAAKLASIILEEVASRRNGPRE